MSDDAQETSELIRSGQYFKEARGWYSAIYIGPISERTFFLITAVLSAIIAIIGFVALNGLMPLKSKPGLLIASERIDEVIPRPVKMIKAGEPVNDAIAKFFLKTYVKRREGYSLADYDKNIAFIQAHTDVAGFDAYAKIYDRAVPESPAARLGEAGSRVVRIDSVRIETVPIPADKQVAKPPLSQVTHRAKVVFTTELQGVESTAKTQWTASIEFHYTDLRVIPTRDPKTGVESVLTEDPQFQVNHYELSKVQS